MDLTDQNQDYTYKNAYKNPEEPSNTISNSLPQKNTCNS